MTRQKLKFALKEQDNRPRLLIADDDTTLARTLSDYFTGKGYNCRITYLVSGAKEIIEYWHPQFILADLMLPHSNALTLFKFINVRPPADRPRVVLMSKEIVKNGVESIRKMGAAGILLKPFSFAEAHQLLDPSVRPVAEMPAIQPLVTNLVKSHSVTTKESGQITKASSPTEIDVATETVLKELHLVNLFLKQAMDQRRPSENLFRLMQMVSLKFKALRCSFIRCLNHETGIVMASNDDQSLSGLPIQLSNYPEIQEAMRTMRVVLIPSVRSSTLMEPVREILTRNRFETIAVFPIFVEGKFFGVTSLRMEERTPIEMFYIDRFGQVAAQIISLTVAAA